MKPASARSRLQIAAVFVAALLVLSFNLWNTGIASGWIDPVLRLGAQDEAVYTHEAIRMITHGDWLTPTLAGRWSFEKPPLLMWLSALSMKMFGIGPFTARIPPVLAGALVAVLCFVAGRAARSPAAGLGAALLCVSSPLLFTMSRHNMTDILLTASALGAFAAQALDPSLLRSRSRIAFTLAIAAGILTKSVAGLLPVFAALLFAALSPHDTGARLRRVAVLSTCAVALASPWFLYHLAIHREWFLADTGFQILTTGMRPHQTAPESHISFYLSRLFYTAPVALILALTGIPAMMGALRRRADVPLLLVSNLLVLGLALMVFRFRSEQYLTPVVPLLALVAVISSPLFQRRFAPVVLAGIAVLSGVKVSNPGQPWGMSYRSGTTIPAAGMLSEYCEERRGNGLYILGVNEEFYALALPLARVHYGWIDPEGIVEDGRPHLFYLGIIRHAGSPSHSSLYAERLRAWGLDSSEPLGTAIVARTAGELAVLVAEHPESDFLVSREVVEKLDQHTSHEIRRITPELVLLYSKTKLPPVTPRWTCAM